MAQDVDLNIVSSELAILYGECDNCHELIMADITPDSKQGKLSYYHEKTGEAECAKRYAEPDIELRLAEGEYLHQIIEAMQNQAV
jgi:hypothetical protein